MSAPVDMTRGLDRRLQREPGRRGTLWWAAAVLPLGVGDGAA